MDDAFEILSEALDEAIADVGNPQPERHVAEQETDESIAS